MMPNLPIRVLWFLAWPALSALATLAYAEDPAAESLPADTQVVRIETRPATVELSHPFAYAQLLLTAELAGGERVDVTRIAQLAEESPLVEVSERRLIRPKGAGQAELKFTVGGQTVTVPVNVTGQAQDYAASFVREVMPAMSKLGCNAGTCHGSANGKNGFKLSLRGYDPASDYQALTDDLGGRRFNRSAPDQSLMLLKACGGVPHVGGVLTKPGEPYYELLRNWIAAGVNLDLDSPRVKSIAVEPQGPVIPLPGRKQQMSVLATYSDGQVRDVTAEAFIESSNTDVAEVDKLGLVTAVRRGEAAMLARYEGAYAATTLIVMGDRSRFEWRDVPENNFIDTLVHNKLQSVKVLPSELCSDADFVRRLYLDLTGLPPQPEEVRAFLSDERDTKVKRDALVDSLIGSPEYIDHWTNKWADLLQVNRKFLGEEGAWALRNWIEQALSNNMPYDKFVYSVLTASGSTLDNPPAGYFKVLRTPEDLAENTTQLFLGVRFNCNKCHDHPFERWTQDNYYHFAAYFAQVARKDAPEFKDRKLGGTAVEKPLSLVEVVYDSGAGEVTHVRTGAVTPPEFPYLHKDMPPESASRREQLARWIATAENQYFAKSFVNRMWSYLFGIGLIEPNDDIRAGNPPSNPELLARLSEEFVSSGFDVQQLVRTICKSRTYQLSIETNEWNEDDQVNFSHALARRLPAETLYDAIHRATGATSKLPGLPSGFRASQTLDSAVKLTDGFLDLFGRPARESACECERSGGVMLGQALNLVNGPTIADAIADPNNRIAKLVEQVKDEDALVEELFLAILCRLPNEAERAQCITAIQQAESRVNGAQDLAWVLINSPAFLFNH